MADCQQPQAVVAQAEPGGDIALGIAADVADLDAASRRGRRQLRIIAEEVVEARHDPQAAGDGLEQDRPPGGGHLSAGGR